MPTLRVVADLNLEVRLHDPSTGADSATVTGRVRADGQDVVLEVSRTPSLRGSAGRRSARRLAQTLTDQGLTLRVRGPHGDLVSIGSGVVGPWWMRLATGSSRIRLGSRRVVRESFTGPRLFQVARPEWTIVTAMARK